MTFSRRSRPRCECAAVRGGGGVRDAGERLPFEQGAVSEADRGIEPFQPRLRPDRCAGAVDGEALRFVCVPIPECATLCGQAAVSA